jgi:cyclic beta-1,2-glucan synthetase
MVRREASPLLAGAPEGLRQLLSPSLGPLLPPLRSEIFGPQRFAQHGRSLGLTHAAAQPRAGSASFFPRLRSNIRMLRQAHAAIAAQASTGYDLSPAALWLLDNFHLIEAQLQAIHEGLPRSFFRALPVLLDEPLAGLPRIYGVAWAFVAHTDSAFDEELLVGYLSAYQESRELRLSEMWALPTTLRVVLIENLRRLAERLATQKAARAVANLCCDRIETCTAADLQQLYGQLDRRGVGAAFLAQVCAEAGRASVLQRTQLGTLRLRPPCGNRIGLTPPSTPATGGRTPSSPRHSIRRCAAPAPGGRAR